MNPKEQIAELFREHADYMFNFAITRVNDVHLAEDLVQETFLSALKGFDSFQGMSKASTWLTAILKNKIIDHYRKKVKEYHKESMEQLGATDEFFDKNGTWFPDQLPKDWKIDYDQRIEQDEFYRVLQHCLGRLKELQRMAFVMKHMDDAATETICKELEITASNYWVLIHRAKLQLRKCLEKNWIKN
ncbi:MAG: sigma-70 family RNA polymerase sigma factor [Bacteroidales bacterium]|nr:sigma-70 family RNA polymerase sigma factor [Bacteroidales bacterium]